MLCGSRWSCTGWPHWALRVGSREQGLTLCVCVGCAAAAVAAQGQGTAVAGVPLAARGQPAAAQAGTPGSMVKLVERVRDNGLVY